MLQFTFNISMKLILTCPHIDSSWQTYHLKLLSVQSGGNILSFLPIILNLVLMTFVLKKWCMRGWCSIRSSKTGFSWIPIYLVSSAAVIWVVTQRFSPTNGCFNPNQICFPLFLVSSAAVIWVVTQRFSPTNGCFNPNQICFPLFCVHVKITECTNHALPIVSSDTNHVSVCQFPA